MDLQFINISTYQGISSDAEHFYAKVGIVNNKEYQESLVTSPTHSMTSFIDFTNGEDLRFFPSREEAEKLWFKDNGHSKDPQVLKWKEDAIADLQEFGTIRFPDIKSIVKLSKEKFPDSVICFSLNREQKRFAKFLISMYNCDDKKIKKEAEDIIDIIEGNGEKKI